MTSLELVLWALLIGALFTVVWFIHAMLADAFERDPDA